MIYSSAQIMQPTTSSPTGSPSLKPSKAPTDSPSSNPTPSPSDSPSARPTASPSNVVSEMQNLLFVTHLVYCNVILYSHTCIVYLLYIAANNLSEQHSNIFSYCQTNKKSNPQSKQIPNRLAVNRLPNFKPFI